MSPAAEPTAVVAELSPADARLAMMELANMISVPMALTAVIRLGVPATIWANGANAPLPSTALLPAGHPDPSVFERLLRLLTSHGVFSEQVGTDGGMRQYTLTSVRHTLVPNGPSDGVDELVHAWPCLHDALLDPAGPESFARVHNGVSAYAYYGQYDTTNASSSYIPWQRRSRLINGFARREATGLMMGAMTGVSKPFMETLLDGYVGGFDGVETLVDVGGSSGLCLEMIMRWVGTIREGINFDLPSVVAAAPPIPSKTLTRINIFLMSLKNVDKLQ
ncbi:hypothetical protein ACQ4PT_016676 [Festuca glaucescens]